MFQPTMLRLSPWPAILQIMASIFGIVQVSLIAKVVGIVVQRSEYAVVLPIFAFFISGFIRSIFDSIGYRIAFRRAYAFVSQKRRETLERCITISPLDINRPASGMLSSTLSEQADMIVAYLARFQSASLKAFVLPMIIFFLVMLYSWLAALVLFITAPLIAIFMALIGWHAKEASKQYLAGIGGLNALFIDRLRGLLTIRSLDAVDITAKRLRDHSEDLCRRTMAVLKVAFLSSAVLELFSALGVAMIAVYVGFSLLGHINFGSRGKSMTIAEGLFILLLAPAFFEPLRELSSVQHEKVSGEAVLNLEDLEYGTLEMLAAKDDSHSSCDGAPAVCLKDISFKYNRANKLVLDKFNLSVAPGEHIALFGSSGCGKSTILSLIAGLAIPESGHIKIGSVLLNHQTIFSVRSRVAWIDQNPHFFSGSIKFNLQLAAPEANDEQITTVLKNVSLDISSKTIIGEGGIGLSDGEMLRLALARASLKPNVDIFLIDEPTVHLDLETSSFVAHSLLTLTKNRTLILSTHDMGLASLMDRIIYIGDRNEGVLV